MKTLDLEKVHKVMSIAHDFEMSVDEENNSNFKAFGQSDSFLPCNFKTFLKHYSFQVEDDVLCVFNNDNIPYEEYSYGIYNYIPVKVLDFTENELQDWLKLKLEEYNKKLAKDKIYALEFKKTQLKRLQEEIDRLEKQ